MLLAVIRDDQGRDSVAVVAEIVAVFPANLQLDFLEIVMVASSFPFILRTFAET